MLHENFNMLGKQSTQVLAMAHAESSEISQSQVQAVYT